MATILLAEDETAVRTVLRHMLKRLGHDVLEAGSAPEALAFAGSYPEAIDVLITDVVMPQTNCDRFVEELLKTRPEIKVIYISGYSAEMLARYGIKQTRPDFIQKPFTAEKLSQKIHQVLGDAQTRRAGQGS